MQEMMNDKLPDTPTQLSAKELTVLAAAQARRIKHEADVAIRKMQVDKWFDMLNLSRFK